LKTFVGVNVVIGGEEEEELEDEGEEEDEGEKKLQPLPKPPEPRIDPNGQKLIVVCNPIARTFRILPNFHCHLENLLGHIQVTPMSDHYVVYIVGYHPPIAQCPEQEGIYVGIFNSIKGKWHVFGLPQGNTIYYIKQNLSQCHLTIFFILCLTMLHIHPKEWVYFHQKIYQKIIIQELSSNTIYLFSIFHPNFFNLFSSKYHLQTNVCYRLLPLDFVPYNLFQLLCST